jgi:hypothetical protein
MAAPLDPVDRAPAYASKARELADDRSRPLVVRLGLALLLVLLAHEDGAAAEAFPLALPALRDLMQEALLGQ